MDLSHPEENLDQLDDNSNQYGFSRIFHALKELSGAFSMVYRSKKEKSHGC